MRIKRIENVKVCGPHSLRVAFNNGVTKRVNLLRLLEGPIFEPLRDPAYFGRVLLDPVAGTVVWPNGADLAPEAVYELPDDDELPRSRRLSKKRPRRTDSKAARR